MKHELQLVASLVFCVALVSCKPAGQEATNSADSGSEPSYAAPAAPTSAPAASGPAPTYAKAEPMAGDSMTAANYPSPMLVHRCLSLAANGPADQAQAVCKRALQLDPRNPQIRAALATP